MHISNLKDVMTDWNRCLNAKFTATLTVMRQDLMNYCPKSDSIFHPRQGIWWKILVELSRTKCDEMYESEFRIARSLKETYPDSKKWVRPSFTPIIQEPLAEWWSLSVTLTTMTNPAGNQRNSCYSESDRSSNGPGTWHSENFLADRASRHFTTISCKGLLDR